MGEVGVTSRRRPGRILPGPGVDTYPARRNWHGVNIPPRCGLPARTWGVSAGSGLHLRAGLSSRFLIEWGVEPGRGADAPPSGIS